jgi:hypothetical protein
MMTAHTFRAVATAAAAVAVLATVGCTPAVDSAAPVPQPTPSANGDPAGGALSDSLQDLGMPIEVRDYVPNMVSCLRERGGRWMSSATASRSMQGLRSSGTGIRRIDKTA